MSYAFPSWQPVEPRRNGLWHNAAVATIVGVLAGTGGNVSAGQIFNHFGTGSASRATIDSQATKADQGLAIELMSIRDLLRLSVAETAQLFGVARPTIYSWLKGKSIRPANADRLHAIVNALTPHLHLLEAQVGRVSHRAIEGRTTLLQTLAAGKSAGQAISQLAGILARETAQRERLARRLQGRSDSRGSADLDTLG